jgi:hypothetical protein
MKSGGPLMTCAPIPHCFANTPLNAWRQVPRGDLAYGTITVRTVRRVLM